MSAATADFTFTIKGTYVFYTYYITKGSDLVTVEEYDDKFNSCITEQTSISEAREMFGYARRDGSLILH